MLHLFSADFSYEGLHYSFTVYKLDENLFQAKSISEVVVLWKNNNEWEGVSNSEDTSLIKLIGTAIDKHLSTAVT